jgi:hypothetical protein
MGRRSYSGEKRRKELGRKAKRDAKQERKQGKGDGEVGGGPPIDWEAMVGGPGAPVPPEADGNDEETEGPEEDGGSGEPGPRREAGA